MRKKREPQNRLVVYCLVGLIIWNIVLMGVMTVQVIKFDDRTRKLGKAVMVLKEFHVSPFPRAEKWNAPRGFIL